MKEREKFITEINKAFANCDSDFISKNVTDDIKWVIVGEKVISGRKDFEASLDRMKLGGPLEIQVNNMINEKNKSVVEGVVMMKQDAGKKKKYAFCYIFIFPDANEHKFSELRTYVSPFRNKE
ncbi:MAG: hypothetical protein R3206_12005 [Salegentibacter mishustinae]|nr:hypothetical protein [Salegentibacter mishustinae]